MTIQPLTVLVVKGTVRDGRNSIYPARYVIARFQEKGHDAELFDMKDYDILLLTNTGGFSVCLRSTVPTAVAANN